MTDTNDQLKPEHFLRSDESDDKFFYDQPRLVTHIDDPACDALNNYFRKHLPQAGDLLDLMSSCVSHLPWDLEYKSVTGVGMNQVELDDNKQLTKRLVHDLNKNPNLPISDHSFDACILTVSVQYLTQPIEVFREIARVLRPGRRCIISFTNRCFQTMAIAICQHMNDIDHAKLVGHYFNEAHAFETPGFENISPAPGNSDPLFIVTAVTKQK